MTPGFRPPRRRRDSAARTSGSGRPQLVRGAVHRPRPPRQRRLRPLHDRRPGPGRLRSRRDGRWCARGGRPGGPPARRPGYGFVDDATPPEVSVWVDAPFRGRGIGRRLTRQMIGEARERGLASLSLSVEQGNRAERPYSSEGFVPVDGREDAGVMVLGPARRPHRSGTPATSMRWTAGSRRSGGTGALHDFRALRGQSATPMDRP
ncbi:GNAT family N-acetyltransferase [Propionibacterium acidifaciens]|uniref:GNAT family N-acetyltransferase n=1 Tax=Propionibacterium acidifaciens TaxID=556499 RepID=UPI0036F1E88B